MPELPVDSPDPSDIDITGTGDNVPEPEHIEPSPPPSPIGVVCSPKRYCEILDECCKAKAREAVKSYVDLSRGEYEDDAVDLFIKIPGHTLSVKRIFYNGTSGGI